VVRKVREAHPHLAHLLDWIAVFAATTSFVFVALWAAAPDSADITLEEALQRAFSYGIPITLGMWGIARASRAGSAVPKRMSEAMPYARLGGNGKPESSTTADDRHKVPPKPLGDTPDA
jgi:hypothetical protein